MNNYIVALLLMLSIDQLLAQQSDFDSSGENSRFIERNSEGWFFYEPIPEEPEEPEPVEETKITKVEPPEPEKEEPKQEPVSAHKPPPFSSAWVKENLPKYLSAAWDDPSPKNVRAFFYLQKFTIDRSARFADVSQEVVAGDPYLDHITRRPLASYASNRVDRYVGLQADKLIDALSREYGIFYFYKKDCEFCIIQAPVIKMLRDVNQFALMPISLEGSDYMLKTFPDQKKDTGHAQLLGIKNYPATFLVSPSGEFESLGQGAMSLPEIKKRIILAAKKRGWITEDEYDSTRPVLYTKNQIDKIFSGNKIKTDLQSISDKNEGFIPPETMIDYIYEQLGMPDAH